MNNFRKLKDLCIKITDGSHYSPTGIDDGFPMLSVKDMAHSGFNYDNCKKISLKDYLELVKSDCKPKLNDVLIAKDGSYLKHVFVIKDEIDQAVLSSIGILRPDLSKVIPEYLKYFLHTESVKKTVAKKYVSGSALPRIILKNFGEIDIVYKDIHSQKEIARVLTLLDSKTDVNNEIIGELEGLAKLIYNYWFVQFDFPNEKGKPYKSSGGKVDFNKELKKDAPVGWKMKPLGQATKTSLGGTPSTEVKDYWDGDIPWLNSGEVANFPLITTEKKITEDAIRLSPTNLLPKGTVLLSITRHLRANILGINACVNQSVVGIQENDKLKASYLYFYISNEIPRLMKLRTGAQQPHINKDIVDNSLILIPPINILNAYYDIVEPMLTKIIFLAKENLQLLALRDWLLPMLMNGQVTIKNLQGNQKPASIVEPTAKFEKYSS